MKSYLTLITLISTLVFATSCGNSGTKYINKEVPVPGDTVYVEVPTEVLVPVEPESEAPVICQVWTSLSNPLLSQAANTTKYLALVNSTKGDLELGLESMSLTLENDDSLPFLEFEGTDAESITKNFSLRCNFKFEVTIAGTHTFSLNSDDGSQLYINGVRAIDNGGAHGMTLKTKNISLPVGIHEIRVLYYAGNGPKGLELKVQKPSIPVPSEDL